jgi:DNA-binding CsgD family transcriptional regulator
MAARLSIPLQRPESTAAPYYVALVGEVQDPGESPEDAVIRQQGEREALLARLPAREREVFGARARGASQREIAAKFGITQQAVAWLQRKAVSRLKWFRVWGDLGSEEIVRQCLAAGLPAEEAKIVGAYWRLSAVRSLVVRATGAGPHRVNRVVRRALAILPQEYQEALRAVRGEGRGQAVAVEAAPERRGRSSRGGHHSMKVIG